MSTLLRPVAAVLLCASFVSTVGAVPGDWDRSFAQNGRIPLSISGQPFSLRAWELQPDGKVVVVGHTTTEAYPGIFLDNSEFIVARFTTTGAPDTSFDGDGYLTFQFGSDVIGTVDLERQADGKLLIVGQAGVPGMGGNSTDRSRLMRLNTDGSRDSTYGPNGEVVLSVANSYFSNPMVKLTANGSALVTGDFGANNTTEFAGVGMFRVTPGGQLDNTFGAGGFASFRGPDHLSPYKVALAADGSIVVGGTLGPYNNYIPVVGRVTPAGQADATFGTGGLLVLPFLQGEGWITAITAMADGRVLVAGRRHDGNGSELPFIARISHNGTMDATFGSSGRIIPAASHVNSLVVEPDGRILAGGSSANGQETPSFLARYNADGSPDLNFGVRGIANTDFGLSGQAASSSLSELVRNTDGTILALVTIADAPFFYGRYAIARFLAQGASAGVLGIRAEYENSSGMGFQLSEDAGHARFFVKRTGGTEGAVTVQYRVVAENATAGADFTPVTGTLTFNDGETTGSFDVPVHDDNIPEQNVDERFYAEIFNPTGGAGLSKPRATIQFSRDFDNGTHIEIYNYTPATVLEGGVARILLYRARFFSDPVTVNYTLNPQNATPGSDYTATNGSVQWAAGEGGLRYIDIPTVNDGTQEPDEYITVNFSEATGLAGMNGAYQNVNIIDDDDPAEQSRITMENRILMVSEAAANATWTVRRSGDDSQPLSVTWSTSGSTGVHAATEGQDYSAASGTLNWTAGDSTSRTITVPLLNDTPLELYEHFGVSLVAPVQVQVVGGNYADAFILDNDGAITQPTITLSAAGPVNESAGTVTLTATVTGLPDVAVSASWQLITQSAMGDDVTADFQSLFWAPGDTSPRNILITINQDTRDELNETFSIWLSQPAGGVVLANPNAQFTIIDDDPTPSGQPPPVMPGIEAVASTVTVNEGTRTATFQFRRVGDIGDGINAYVFTVDGTATAPGDYAAGGTDVSWIPNEAGVKTVEVQINGDTIVEATETATMRLSVYSYDGTPPPPPQNLTLTITDDDNGTTPPPPPANVAFVSTTASVPENGVTITVQVGRTGNTSVASSVDYATAIGTAGAADFTASTGTLTWAAGDTASKMLVITLLPDSVDEADENFTITLSNPSSGTALADATMTVTIVDDDVPSGGGVANPPPPLPSGGSGKSGGGGSESYLGLLALASILLRRRQLRRRSALQVDQREELAA